MLKLSRLPSGEPEVFVSIQGEGASAGLPSVFVRLALCNLWCRWCDSSFTWDWARYDPKQQIIGIDTQDLVQQIEETGVGNVVITGGEPLLQQRELVTLASGLHASRHRLEVETNGTIVPDARLAELVDQWNVSPKLANAGVDLSKREVAAALQWFAAQPNAYVKFVVGEAADLDEVESLVSRYRVSADRVVLMPEGTDAETLTRRSAWLVERCCQSGYRFSTRLHVLLWGDERGR